MKIQTVNQLISVFKDIATRHYQINGFGIGDDWENGASEEKMHPVLWINPVTASMPESESTGYKTFEIDFEVRVFDLVSKGESNENDVLSDCIDILKDIILEFKGHPYYVNSQLNIIDDISFEAFTEEFDEDVSGWVCELSLMTPILNSFCGIPAADITGFEFPGIDCPDVNVLCPVFVEDVTGVYPIVVNTVGTTKEVSIVGGVGSDTYVISGVYDAGTLTLTRNDDVDVVVTGFDTGGDNDYTTAATLSGNIITFDRTDTVGAYSVDLTTAINSAPDKFVSSGAYDEINNKIVLTLNDASTVDIDTSAIGGGGGILGIANTSGVYTYYSTYTLAMASAVAGDTIEQFGNITETSNVTITIKDEVHVNMNGYTYTIDGSTVNGFYHDDTLYQDTRFQNGTIRHINSGGSGFTFYIAGESHIDCTGLTVVSDASYCLYFNSNGNKKGRIIGGSFIHTGGVGFNHFVEGRVFNSYFNTGNGALRVSGGAVDGCHIDGCVIVTATGNGIVSNSTVIGGTYTHAIVNEGTVIGTYAESSLFQGINNGNNGLVERSTGISYASYGIYSVLGELND